MYCLCRDISMILLEWIYRMFARLRHYCRTIGRCRIVITHESWREFPFAVDNHSARQTMLRLAAESNMIATIKPSAGPGVPLRILSEAYCILVDSHRRVCFTYYPKRSLAAIAVKCHFCGYAGVFFMHYIQLRSGHCSCVLLSTNLRRPRWPHS